MESCCEAWLVHPLFSKESDLERGSKTEPPDAGAAEGSKSESDVRGASCSFSLSCGSTV